MKMRSYFLRADETVKKASFNSDLVLVFGAGIEGGIMLLLSAVSSSAFSIVLKITLFIFLMISI